MNTAKESNIKNIAVISFVSVLLFGIFYYLITDASSSPSTLKTENKETTEQSTAQNYLAEAKETPDSAKEGQVKGDTSSVFKTLSTQKSTVQPKMVLGGSDQQTTQSTVPATGSDTIFGAFVFSSLVMFTGIYLLLSQPKNAALAKFEKRVIRELD